MTKNAGGCFSLYENLLSNNARSKWHKILASQTKASPWTDLNGNIHNKAREQTLQAFEDCVTFLLLTVFPEDAAEQKQYYINLSLRKPGKVTIRNFVSRI